MIPYDQAAEEMQARALFAWRAAHLSVLGVAPLADTFRVSGQESTDKPDPSRFWVRCHLKPVISKQANLGQNPNGTRKYDSEQICTRLSDSFVGYKTPGEVWFRNVTIDEDMPTEDQWVQVQMWSEWKFQEIR